MYKSETSKVRHLVLPYCIGKGCDIGAAGDKVVKKDCDYIGDPKGYAVCGEDPIDIPCHINEAKPFGSIPTTKLYDYVYSSHLIEDFVPTKPILEEHSRLLKVGGNLILIFPDQARYEENCKIKEETPNEHHRIKEMGLQYMLKQIASLGGGFKVIYTSNCEVLYNVIVVAKKVLPPDFYISDT